MPGGARGDPPAHRTVATASPYHRRTGSADGAGPPFFPRPMSTTRRRWLGRHGLLAAGAATFASLAGARAAAPRPASERMPGDPPEHRVIYQVNHADAEYLEHILGSVGAMIGRYEDNVAIALVAFGPGIHLLARQPRRPVSAALRERVRAQARDYGVELIACGNTMKTLGWTAADLIEGVKVEEVGAAVLMERQERGWAYIAW